MAEDYIQIKQNFLSELTKASKNQKSSLSYIQHTLSQKSFAQKGIVQGIVMGGTNYVIVLSKVTDKRQNKILKIKKGKLPVFKNIQTFSAFLNAHLDPKATALGLNFAFPLHPVIGFQNTLGGILIKGSKEHALEGLIGQDIGEVARKIYFTKYKKQIPVAVANDTICLTLADNGDEDGAIVLGTGFNISLKIIQNNNLTVINLEAGNFDGLRPTKALKIIDNKSEHPGHMLFEKAISGRYLVTYFNEQAKLLNLKISPLKTTEELSRLAETNQKTEDELARSILERSAFLVASAIAGVYEFRKCPSKLELITEGSLFWKGFMYQENVQKQLVALGVPKNAVKFKYIEDSSLKGALGLLI